MVKPFNIEGFQVPDSVTILMPKSSLPSAKFKLKEEMVEALLAFGSLYIQCYPNKIVQFLQYVHFIMDHFSLLNLRGLLEVDKELRSYYVTHPDQSWSIPNDLLQAVTNIKMNEIFQAPKTPTTQPKSRQNFQQSPAGKQKQLIKSNLLTFLTKEVAGMPHLCTLVKSVRMRGTGLQSAHKTN